MTHAKNFCDLTGQKFGRVTALYPIMKGKRTYWNCLCDCGKEKIINASALKRGLTKSCGCLKSELTGKRFLKHGMRNTPEYQSWCGMINRCYNQNSEDYPDYAGRGIKICGRYKNSFQDFFDDLGYKPTPKHTVDRIDNDLNYSCGKCDECIENGWKMNVRWGTKKEQAQNTRQNVWITYNGETMCQMEWARKLGVPHARISNYSKKYSAQEAIAHYSDPNRKTINQYK